MTKEIEIEFKAMLTEAEFHTILAAYPFPSTAIIQTNHYFETADFALRNAKSALRIREIGDTYVLTLKQAKTDHVLETHDQIDHQTFTNWIQGKIDFLPATGKELKQIGLTAEQLKYAGALVTERYTFTKDEVTYCLDKSIYGQVTDYELEIEESVRGKAEEIFQDILQQFAIKPLPPETKIARFFRNLNA